ncbi:MAG: DUF6062 family protein [Oscillospiraceae bacterium]|jgi:hypothetical protein
MAETIYTIPINEAFEKREGCPFCRLRRELEASSLEYILGPALMEPDVRMEANRLGFCARHYDSMLEMRNRLGLSLLVESRLVEVLRLLEKPPANGKKTFGIRKHGVPDDTEIANAAGSCFICHRIEFFEEKYISNALSMWRRDPDFQEKFKKQPFFCLKHTGSLLETAQSALPDKKLEEFRASLMSVNASYAEKLREDLQGFIRSFDHRFANAGLTLEQQSALDRCIEFLAGKNK